MSLLSAIAEYDAAVARFNRWCEYSWRDEPVTLSVVGNDIKFTTWVAEESYGSAVLESESVTLPAALFEISDEDFEAELKVEKAKRRKKHKEETMRWRVARMQQERAQYEALRAKFERD